MPRQASVSRSKPRRMRATKTHNLHTSVWKRKFVIQAAPGVPYSPRHWALASRNEAAFRKSQKWVEFWSYELPGSLKKRLSKHYSSVTVFYTGIVYSLLQNFQNDFLLHRGVTVAYKRGIKNFLAGTLVFKKISMPTIGPMVPAAQASQKLLRDQDVPPSVIFHNHKWIWCRLRKLFFLSKSREMIKPWKQHNLIVREIIVKDDVIFLQRQLIGIFKNILKIFSKAQIPLVTSTSSRIPNKYP